MTEIAIADVERLVIRPGEVLVFSVDVARVPPKTWTNVEKFLLEKLANAGHPGATVIVKSNADILTVVSPE